MPRVDPGSRQQVIQAGKRAEHVRSEQLRGLLVRASRAILRTTAYTPRSACTGANEPRFGVPSSTTRSTFSMPSQASAARLTSPPMLCATIITRARVARAARSRAPRRARRRRAASRSRETPARSRRCADAASAADRCTARCRARRSAPAPAVAAARDCPMLMSTGSSHRMSFGSGARRAPKCEPMMPGTM